MQLRLSSNLSPVWGCSRAGSVSGVGPTLGRGSWAFPGLCQSAAGHRLLWEEDLTPALGAKGQAVHWSKTVSLEVL